MNGAESIAVERARQLAPRSAGGEGWDAEHDHGHADELALAAACYALPDRQRAIDYRIGHVHINFTLWRWLWPWAEEWWKPADRRRELVKAGALIAAAIDSLDDEAEHAAERAPA